MDKLNIKFLILGLIVAVFVVGCTKQEVNTSSLEVIKLGDSSFMLTKAFGDLPRASIVDLSFMGNEINLEVGGLYRLETFEDQEDLSTNKIIVDSVEELGDYKYMNLSIEEGQNIKEALGDKAYLIDVRTSEEFASGYVEDAINIPDYVIQDEIEKVTSDKEGAILLIYCRSGSRSKSAARTLSDMGYRLVFDLGGIMTYKGDLIR